MGFSPFVGGDGPETSDAPTAAAQRSANPCVDALAQQEPVEAAVRVREGPSDAGPGAPKGRPGATAASALGVVVIALLQGGDWSRLPGRFVSCAVGPQRRWPRLLPRFSAAP